MKSVEERNMETELRDAAAARGALVFECSPGHFQIRGPLLVNYYPLSKKRTAYIACTTRGIHHATPTQAVALAFEAPPLADADHKAERGNAGRYSRWKRRMWKAGMRQCHWCLSNMNRVPGHSHQMTLDHRIPLARGGLDNPNNWVAAHAKCNHSRGHDMPELSSAANGEAYDEV